MTQSQKANPTWIRSPRTPPHLFTVYHFAGEVTYDVRGFLRSNKDTRHSQWDQILIGSDNPFIRGLFPKVEKPSKSSISFQMRSEMSQLVEFLNRTTIHYVRCLLTNNSK